MREYYSISELTKDFGITTRTLRFYEDEGLIQPVRRGRTRLYTQADRNLIAQILRGKRLNFSLAEIREILQMYGELPEGEEQLRAVIHRIEEKRENLRRLRRDIDDSLHELERIEESCFERLAELRVNT